MSELGRGEEELAPHLAPAHRLPGGLGGMVAVQLLQNRGMEGPVLDPAVVARSANGLDGARVADGGTAAGDDTRLGILGGLACERMLLGAAVLVPRGASGSPR
jgi:hypothetical protein